MANTEIVAQIISMTQDFLTYMLPVIAVLAGIHFIVSLLLDILGFGRSKSFWG